MSTVFCFFLSLLFSLPHLSLPCFRLVLPRHATPHFGFPLPYLTLPALPYLALFCFTLLYFILSCLALPCLVFLCFILFRRYIALMYFTAILLFACASHSACFFSLLSFFAFSSVSGLRYVLFALRTLSGLLPVRAARYRFALRYPELFVPFLFFSLLFSSFLCFSVPPLSRSVLLFRSPFLLLFYPPFSSFSIHFFCHSAFSQHFLAPRHLF